MSKESKFTLKKLAAVLLALCLCIGLFPAAGGAYAAEEQNAEQHIDVNVQKIDGSSVTAEVTMESGTPEALDLEGEPYTDDDIVRVMIVLKEEPVLEREHISSQILSSPAALQAKTRVDAEQEAMQAEIEQNVLDGRTLEVTYQYAYAINAIAARLTYGELKEVQALDGVKSAFIVPVFDLYPMTAPSGGMVGAPQAWSDAGLDGTGMRIAIIDSGIDVDHPSFAADPITAAITADGAGNYLTRMKLSSVRQSLNAYRLGTDAGMDVSTSSLFKSNKIPYAFNYVDVNATDVGHLNVSDHGTHVAGIAAANRLAATDVVGIAPMAQLLVMKVFGLNGGAYMDDLVAAIEDAVILNADVINLSLGSDAGFSNDYPEFDAVLTTVAQTDVVVAMAGGNNYSSSYMNTHGYNLPLTSNPDNGVVGSPGSYVNALSVASVDNVVTLSQYLTLDGTRYVITASRNGTQLNTLADRGALRYLVIGDPATGEGIFGAPEDFPSEGDFSDCVAVVSRGELNFSEKLDNAQAAGFAGLIIYNNQPGTISMDVSGATLAGRLLPCGSITAYAGAMLIAAAEQNAEGLLEGTLSFSAEAGEVPSETAWRISDFSSWGTTPDLKIKPEISGVGGNILSCVDNGGYDLNSGTSMASPQVAGMAALVLEYLRETYPDMDLIERRVVAQALLMSTAAPVLYDTGLPFSPRQQGAGLANVFNAVSTGAYLSVDGSEKPKAELGDDPGKSGVYNISFNIENMSGAPLDYSLETLVMTENHLTGADGLEYISQSPYALQPAVHYSVSAAAADLSLDFNENGTVETGDARLLWLAVQNGEAQEPRFAAADLNHDGSIDRTDVQLLLAMINRNASYEASEGDGTVITVPAGGATITATITLSEADRAYMDANFENGIYVEGFVYLHNVSEDPNAVTVDLSLPFLAFYGDWTAAPVFDNSFRGDPATWTLSESGTPNTVWTSRSTVLGYNPYVQDDEYIAERSNVISPEGSGEFGIYDMYLTLMRGLRELEVSVSDQSSGEVIHSLTLDYARKSCFDPNNGIIMPLSWLNDTGGYIYWSDIKEQTEDGDELMLNFRGVLDYGQAEDQNNQNGLIQIPLYVDETAPELIEDSLDLTYKPLDGSKTITLQVQDNRYVAAVLVLNSTASKVLQRYAINQTEKGVATELSLDVSELHSKLTLAVLDYGGNVNYYAVDFKLDGGESEFDLSKPFGYRLATPSLDAPAWVTFDDTNYAEPTVIHEDANRSEYLSGEYLNDVIYAVDKSGEMFALPFNDLGNPLPVMKFDFQVGDMAYDYASGVLLGLTTVFEGSDSYMTVIAIDTNTATYAILMKLAMPEGMENGYATNKDRLYLLTLACTTEGQLYGIGSDGNLYALGSYAEHAGSMGEVVQARLVGATGGRPNSAQSMAYDHNTDTMYWVYGRGTSLNYFSDLMTVDLETGEATSLGAVNAQIVSLFVPYSQGGSGGTAGVSSIHINEGDQNLLPGGEVDLSVQIIPWNASRNILWSSSDDAVATVDQNGHVLATGAGTATITATAASNPNVSASITVTVKDLLKSIGGYGMYSVNGGPIMGGTTAYGWHTGSTDKMQPNATTADTAPILDAGTRIGNEIYATKYSDSATSFTRYDLTDNMAVLETGAFGAYGVSSRMLDFTSDPVSGATIGTCFMSAYSMPVIYYGANGALVNPALLKDGATNIVGIAAYQANGQYALDNMGNLYRVTTAYSFNESKFVFVAKTGVGSTNMGSATTPLHSSLCYDAETNMLYFAQAQSLGATNHGVVFYAIDVETGDTFELGRSADLWDFAGLYIAD